MKFNPVRHTAYKVVRNNDGLLTSATNLDSRPSIRKKYEVVYHTDGRIIRPKQGELFVFSELWRAHQYAKESCGPHEVWAVQAHGMHECEGRVVCIWDSMLDLSRLDTFWEEKKAHKMMTLDPMWLSYPPAKTCWCKSLKMLHKVE